MNNNVTIGIDNGTTGTLGIIAPSGALFEAIPVKETMHYAQAKGFVKRIDRVELRRLLEPYVSTTNPPKVFIEQPVTMRFAVPAVLLGHRAYEAVLTVCEDLGFGVETITPRDWQRSILGAKIEFTKISKGKTKTDTKKASQYRGIELYPYLSKSIKDHGDADGLLIAHHFHFHSHQ